MAEDRSVPDRSVPDRSVPGDDIDDVVEELRRCNPVDIEALPSSRSTEAMTALERILDSGDEPDITKPDITEPESEPESEPDPSPNPNPSPTNPHPHPPRATRWERRAAAVSNVGVIAKGVSTRRPRLAPSDTSTADAAAAAVADCTT